MHDQKKEFITIGHLRSDIFFQEVDMMGIGIIGFSPDQIREMAASGGISIQALSEVRRYLTADQLRAIPQELLRRAQPI